MTGSAKQSTFLVTGMDCFVALLPCANASRLSQAMTVFANRRPGVRRGDDSVTAARNKKSGPHGAAFFYVIPGRAIARTRNLEIPGLVLRTIPE
jgi:hypothetical protein